MSIIAHQPSAPTEHGLGLQKLAANGSEAEFVAAFMETLRHLATEAGFSNPAGLQPSLHRHRLTAIGGAGNRHMNAFFKALHTELDCNAIYPSGPSSTLHGMARFYYERLREKPTASR